MDLGTSMKKFFVIIIVSLLFCNASSAENIFDCEITGLMNENDNQSKSFFKLRFNVTADIN